MTFPAMRFARQLTLLVSLSTLAAPALSAQERLVGAWVASTGAFFENWSLPDAVGMSTVGGKSVMVSGASQITLPLAVVVPIREGWTVDAYGAYVRGQVRLALPDASGETSYSLNGMTDTRVRVVGQLIGESLLLTAGVTAPTGRTHLSTNELTALSVLAAPGLRFRSPFLGAGAGATVGFILSETIGGMSVALGSSYEARGTYAPAEALGANQGATNLRPGNAAHLSLAAEKIKGATRHLLNFGGDFFQAGELTNSTAAGANNTLALGPSFSGSYEIDAVVANWESTLFLLGRHRAEYRLGGIALTGSGRTEVEGGAQMYRTINPSVGLRLGVEGRVHSTGVLGASSTGTDAFPDVGFTTAGVKAGGGTVALRLGDPGSKFSLEPFVRAQLGTLDFNTATRSITGFSGGATLTARF